MMFTGMMIGAALTGGSIAVAAGITAEPTWQPIFVDGQQVGSAVIPAATAIEPPVSAAPIIMPVNIILTFFLTFLLSFIFLPPF